MGIFDRLKGLLGDDGTSGASASSDDNFVCGACRATLKRQHHECPTCGSSIVLPIERTDVEDDGGL